jgi:hypothetical protein
MIISGDLHGASQQSGLTQFALVNRMVELVGKVLFNQQN